MESPPPFDPYEAAPEQRVSLRLTAKPRWWLYPLVVLVVLLEALLARLNALARHGVVVKVEDLAP